MSRLLVIHDQGASGGGEWEEAFAAWPGDVVAPDLPGHGAAPAPVGGHHEVGDAVFALVDHLRPADTPQPVVVGIGANGHAARVLAVGGRASALVLVDGLGGPWLDVAGRNAALRSVRREILSTPAALAPHTVGSTDPRASMVLGATDRDHVVAMCAAVPVPTLVVETPASPTPDPDEIVAAFRDASLVRIDGSSPTEVADAVVAWRSG